MTGGWTVILIELSSMFRYWVRDYGFEPEEGMDVDERREWLWPWLLL